MFDSVHFVCFDLARFASVASVVESLTQRIATTAHRDREAWFGSVRFCCALGSFRLAWGRAGPGR